MVNKNIVYDLYSIMENQNILISFIGDFNMAINDALLQIANPKNAAEEEFIAKTKVYKIMVECLENIRKHSDVVKDDSSPSLFYLSKNNGFYFVVTGNYILNSNIEKLKKDIESLNNLNKLEVRQRYRDVLKLGRISERQGAGLGIIDVVMKAGTKLEYFFVPYKEQFSFFILKVPVPLHF